jgi:4-hydroxybenzoate polyprenyltransferase
MSTIKHLRFLHSLVLTPVFFFALAQHPFTDFVPPLVLFLILVLTIFPASHGFNSFYDRDEGSIGGLEAPPRVDVQLLSISIILEVIGIALTYLFFDLSSAVCLVLYGVASKLYSHPAVRLKAMPWVSLFIVGSFQGALIYLLVVKTTGHFPFRASDYVGAGAAFLMVMATYPITQIYQHDEDRQRGDLTLSRVLGIKGTFLFSGLCLLLTFGSFLFIWDVGLPLVTFFILQLPAGIIFFQWMRAAVVDVGQANYRNTARCLHALTLTSSLGFVALLLLGRFT